MLFTTLAAIGMGAAAALVAAATAISQSESVEDYEEIQKKEIRKARKIANQARKAALLKAEKEKCQRAKEDLDRRIQNFINFTRGNRIKGCCNGLSAQSETTKPLTLKKRLVRLVANSVATLNVEPNIADRTYKDAHLQRAELDSLCRQLRYVQDLINSTTGLVPEHPVRPTNSAGDTETDRQNAVNTKNINKKAKEIISLSAAAPRPKRAARKS